MVSVIPVPSVFDGTVGDFASHAVKDAHEQRLCSDMDPH